MKRKILPLLLILSIAISCDRPKCTNTNPVFNDFDPSSNEYKKELIAKIEDLGNSNVKYWIAGFEELNDKQYMMLNVQGSNLCALGHFEIKNTNKLETFIRNKGLGYRGARIIGFKFSILEADSISLVYLDLKRIID